MKKKPIGGSAQYLEELKERHEHLKYLVKDRINEAQQKQKKNYDKTYRVEKPQLWRWRTCFTERSPSKMTRCKVLRPISSYTSAARGL